jgi:hypothetical protein
MTKTTTSVTVNKEQGLFVIPCGEGFTCLGFDVCKKWTKALLAEIKKSFPSFRYSHILDQLAPKDNIEAYGRYEELLSIASHLNKETGYRFTYELEPRFNGLLGKRVQVTDKEGNKRRFYVGKSMGFIPVYLEIAKRTSSGGPAVCILDTDTITVLKGER